MSIKEFIQLAAVVVVVFFLLHLWLANPGYFGTSKSELSEIQNDALDQYSNKLFSEQLQFRERLIKQYHLNLSAIRENALDSLIVLDSVQNKIAIRYLLPSTSSEFKIPLENYTLQTHYLVGYDTLFIRYSIDDDKMTSIIKNLQVTNPEDFINVLKFQDYLKTTITATFHHRVALLVIFFGVAIFTFFVIAFLEDSSNKNEEHRILTRSDLDSISGTSSLSSVTSSHLFETPEATLESLDRRAKFDRLEEKIQKRLKEFEERSKGYFIIEHVVSKAEQKSREVQSRSTLMLVSGLIMAFIGVIVFYLTLPSNISSTTEIMKIITLSVRPTLILIFIEAVSWYLLKQHQVLLDDYKYYHSIYNKKVGYLASYQLLAESKLSDEKLKGLIPAMILSEQVSANSENKKQDESIETSSTLLKSLLEKIIGKI